MGVLFVAGGGSSGHVTDSNDCIELAFREFLREARNPLYVEVAVSSHHREVLALNVTMVA